MLASATFTNETSSGWQQANLPNPVGVTANTLYVASYQTSVGHFSLDQGYFTAFGVNNSPLHASADTSGYANDVYAFTSSPAFPTNTLNASNYWVDVVFNYTAGTGATLKVTTTSLPNETQGIAYHQSLTASGGATPYKWALISGALPSGLTLSPNESITGTPTAVETSNFTIRVTHPTTPHQTLPHTYATPPPGHGPDH